MIHVEKRGRRIAVMSPGRIPELKVLIPGAYQTAAGHWTIPLDLEACKILQARFGSRLTVGTELKRWAIRTKASREYMSNLSKAKDARLHQVPKLAPRLAKAMKRRKYQRVGARFIADNHATLVADDPGLGKTLQVMAGILESGTEGPYLVVAPKTAAESVWQREIERWLPSDHRAVTLPELRYQRERRLKLTRYGPKTWLIVHPEVVMVQKWWVCTERKCGVKTPVGNSQQIDLDCGHQRTRKTINKVDQSYPHLFTIEWGAIIVDESHESLIRRTGVPTQRRRGLDMLRLRQDGLKIAMSGTPFDSKPHQLWGTLNWLDPNTYSAFWRWAEMYWEKGGYTGFEIGEFRKDREHLLWDSLNGVALRRTKAEVAQDLPPKTYVGTPLIPEDPESPIGVWLPMDGKQETAYRQMEAASMAELESGSITAVSALAELTRLKQLACSYGDVYWKDVRVRCDGNSHRNFKPCGKIHAEPRMFYKPSLPSNKFTWTVNSLEEWGYPREPITKVVIVSMFTGILNEFRMGIEKHFRRKPGSPLCTAITGQTPTHKRRAIIDRFNQEGGPQVMLLNVKAGGTAITLDTADRMIFVSETRIPDQQKQAEDRIHRVSNPRNVMYYYLRSLETVDVGTALVNQEMIAATHRLLDERRGVAYTRQVLDLGRKAQANR